MLVVFLLGFYLPSSDWGDKKHVPLKWGRIHNRKPRLKAETLVKIRRMIWLVCNKEQRSCKTFIAKIILRKDNEKRNKGK